MDESTASFLDKTDWRITLHRKLEDCVNAEGTIFYPQRVKRLISTISARFPNWDAKKEVTDEIIKLEKHYTELHGKWLEGNPNAKRRKKEQIETHYFMLLNKDVFEFIKNRCAEKRMLLWGIKKIIGGTQMED